MKKGHELTLAVKAEPPGFYKWAFAIGTTSRVPNSKRHYLIADYDLTHPPSISLLMGLRPQHIFIQQTEHGWHVYTDLTYTFKKLLEILSLIKADPSWCTIGAQRGYLFLADKGPIHLPWPVERMSLYAKRKKTNTP
jgi:hypothetical protein